MTSHPFSQLKIKSRMRGLARMMGWVRDTDYRLLNHHLLRMQEKQDLDALLAEIAHCLAAMLDYRLFAFVIRDDTGVDVWIDPSMFRDAFSRIVAEDLGLDSDADIRFMGPTDTEGLQQRIARENLDVRSFEEKDFTAHLYLATGRKLLPYHDEILMTLLSGLRAALVNHVRIRRLEGAVARDGLTGCYNRREFDLQLRRQLATAKRHGNPFSLIFFDLDHFKKVNDLHGHLAGDAVLRTVAREVGQRIRTGDLLCRYGGEEFAILLPETEGQRAADLAERLRSALAGFEVDAGKGLKLRVTASFGVATASGSTDAETLLAQADAMLYRAKEEGRNRVAF